MERLFGELSLVQLLFAALVLCLFIVLAWMFHFFLLRAAKKFAQKTKTELDNALILVAEKPLIAIIILTGIYVSSLFIPLESTLRSYLLKGVEIVLSLLGIYIVAGILYSLTRWYHREVVTTETRIAHGFVQLFHIMIILLALLAVVLVSLSNLNVDTAPITGWLSEHGWRIVLIILLAIVAVLLLASLVPRLLEASIGRRSGEQEEEVRKRTNTLSRVLVNAGQVVVLFVAIFTILSELRIDIAPILAGAGVVGIAIGFGAQSLVKDLIAGLFIIMESQFRVGDVVRIADIGGLVEDISLRRTVLRDLDGIVHFIPNGEIRVASNYTKEWSRVNLNISVAYGEDLDRVISVINRVGNELAEDPQWAPLILKPPQALRVDKFGDSGIEIKILGDTKPIRQWDVMGELRLRLKKAFDQEGIEIPWPHTKVYFGNAPDSGISDSKKKNNNK